MRLHYPLNANGAEDAGQLPWTDGVPLTGIQGSYPGHAIVTDTEAEILAAIDASGQTRNGSDLAQLAQAMARGIFLGQFGGTANALAAALPNNIVLLSLQAGTRLTGFVTAPNTGGVTLALTGIGSPSGTQTAPLLRKDGTALQAGDLPVGQLFDIRVDTSGSFRLTGLVTSDLGGGAAVFLAANSNGQAWTTPGTYTFTVPPGVTRLFIRVWGGGGGGGGTNASGGVAAGGGAGGFSWGVFAVTPGQVLTIVVGARGLAGPTTPGNGGTGGTSSVSVSPPISATGGAGGGGYNGAGLNTTSAPGGIGAGGQFNEQSGSGGFGYNIPGAGIAAGGIGGGAQFGGFPSPQAINAAGQGGYSPGGGAQGGVNGNGGGLGGAGRVDIWWD